MTRADLTPFPPHYPIWLWYYLTCEKHDRGVCLSGDGMPSRPGEHGVVSRFATRCRKVVRLFTVDRDASARNSAMDLADHLLKHDVAVDDIDDIVPGYAKTARLADKQLALLPSPPIWRRTRYR